MEIIYRKYNKSWWNKHLNLSATTLKQTPSKKSSRKHKPSRVRITKKAIDLLDKAKKILPQLNEGKGENHQTVANNTIGNASLELTYRSKLVNLYYNIR